MTPLNLQSHAPAFYKSVSHWGIWKEKPNLKEGKKAIKMPLDIRSGKAGKSTDPLCFTPSLEEAQGAASKYRATGLSVGLFATEEYGLVCIDLDGCVDDTGIFSDWAKQTLARLEPHALMVEISHSGRGLHIWLWAKRSQTRNKFDATGTEIYTNARYIAITGNLVSDASSEVPNPEETSAALADFERLCAEQEGGVAQVAEGALFTFEEAENKGAPAPSHRPKKTAQRPTPSHANKEAIEEVKRAVDLPALVQDFYGITLRGERCAAWFRGGNNDTALSFFLVSDGGWRCKDFGDEGEVYDAISLVSRVDGSSFGETLRRVADYAGVSLDGGEFEHRKQETAQRRARQDAKTKIQRERAHVAITNHCAASPLESPTAYLQRKGVGDLLLTHDIGGGDFGGLDGGGLKPVTYKGVQGFSVAACNIEGEVTAVQIITDDPVDMYGTHTSKITQGNKKGSFICIRPKGVSIKQAIKSQRFKVCEGLATGASIALAFPKDVIIVAFDAGNLAPVIKAIRKLSGYTRKVRGAQVATDIHIYADNDDVRGTKGENPGLQAAHGAGFDYLCLIYTPTSKTRDKVDVNDLHREKGLEAVRRIRKANPCKNLAQKPRKPHRNAASLEKNITYDEPRMHPLPEIDKGTMIIKGGQGVGKTHQLEVFLKQHSDASVLLLTHRRALADNLYSRFKDTLPNLTHYEAAMPEELKYVNQTVICFDSLYKLESPDRVKPYDIVMIDESEQFVRNLKSSHIENKPRNLNVLSNVLGKADLALFSDADAGELTDVLISEYRSQHEPIRITNTYKTEQGTHVNFLAAKLDSYLRMVEKSRDGKRGWHGHGSKRGAENHGTALTFLEPDKSHLLITSETATNKLVKEYLQDSNNARPHHNVINSPQNTTGTDDSSDNYDYVNLSANRSISTSWDVVQQGKRVRNPKGKTITIYAPQGSQEVNLEAIDARHNKTLEAEMALRAKSGITIQSEASEGYRNIKVKVQYAEARDRADLKNNIAQAYVDRGATVTAEVPQSYSKAETQKRENDKASLGFAGFIRLAVPRLKAKRLTDTEAQTLSDKSVLTESEKQQLSVYTTLTLYGYNPQDATEQELLNVLIVDLNSKLPKEIRAMREALYSPEELEAVLKAEGRAGKLKEDTDPFYLRHDFRSKLLEALGVTDEMIEEAVANLLFEIEWQQRIETLTAEAESETNRVQKGQLLRELKREKNLLEAHRKKHKTIEPSYSAEALAPFIAYVAENYEALQGANLNMPKLSSIKAKPLKAVSTWLRHLGLKQENTQKRTKKRTYALNSNCLGGMGSFVISDRINLGIMQKGLVIKHFYIPLLHNSLQNLSETGITPCLGKAIGEYEPLGVEGMADKVQGEGLATATNKVQVSKNNAHLTPEHPTFEAAAISPQQPHDFARGGSGLALRDLKTLEDKQQPSAPPETVYGHIETEEEAQRRLVPRLEPLTTPIIDKQRNAIIAALTRGDGQGLEFDLKDSGQREEAYSFLALLAKREAPIQSLRSLSFGEADRILRAFSGHAERFVFAMDKAMNALTRYVVRGSSDPSRGLEPRQDL